MVMGIDVLLSVFPPTDGLHHATKKKKKKKVERSLKLDQTNETLIMIQTEDGGMRGSGEKLLFSFLVTLET